MPQLRRNAGRRVMRQLGQLVQCQLRLALLRAQHHVAKHIALSSPRNPQEFPSVSFSHLRFPSLPAAFTTQQETLPWLRAVRRRRPHLPRCPESTPCDPDPRNPPRKHCKRALLLSRRRHFSRTLRRASRTEQQSAAPAARVFHIFPQCITFSLFVTLFYEVLIYGYRLPGGPREPLQD